MVLRINGVEENWWTAVAELVSTEMGEEGLSSISGLCIFPLYLECIDGSVNPFFPLWSFQLTSWRIIYVLDVK